jgi:hypothetical protein
MQRILAAEIVNDVQGGMNDQQLMLKHRLSRRQVSRLLMKLVELQILSHQEAYDTSEAYRIITDRPAKRAESRIRVNRRLVIFNDDTSQRGYVRDVSKTGQRIAGILAKVDSVMTLRLPLPGPGTAEQIEFVAECRWNSVHGKKQRYATGGFKIAMMSDTARASYAQLLFSLQKDAQEASELLESESENGNQEQSGRVEIETDGFRAFSGELDGVDVLDLIQFLLLTRRKNVLKLSASDGTESETYLDDGRIVHAVLGDLQGNSAFFACMKMPGGRFTLVPWSEPRELTIHDPAELLLVEAAHRRDEFP